MHHTFYKATAFFFLLNAAFFNSISAQSEVFNWAKAIAGPQLDEANSIKLDAAGNAYVVGNFNETVDFDPGDGVFEMTSNGGYDIFILKLNPSGNFIWAKAVGGTNTDFAYAVDVDADGNVYTTGNYTATVDFDPGNAEYPLTSKGYDDMFILKMNTDGNFVWAKTIGGIDQKDIGKSIEVDNDGNVYTTGSFWYTSDFDPGPQQYLITPSTPYAMFILKLDADGNFVWAKAMNGGGSNIDSGHSIALDAQGNVYTIGLYTGTADFDPGDGVFNLSSTTSNYSDTYISKLDNDGNFIWAKSFGGAFWDYGYAIALDDAGNIYTSGGYGGLTDFDPGSGVYELDGLGLFISKLDNDGNFIWAKTMGGGNYTISKSLALDSQANIFITGTFSGTADFDPGDEEFNLTANDQDIHFCKLDSDGNFIWAKSIGGELMDNGYAVAVDNSDNLYVVGRFQGTADFNPDSPVYSITNPFPYPDAFILKYGSSVVSTPSVVVDKSSFNVYPIPSESKLIIEKQDGIQVIDYSIVDNLGRIILRGTLRNRTTEIDIEHFSNGIYFLKTENEVLRFIKS